MLKKVKSQYILQIIFDPVNDPRKLSLIQYNKYLQKNLEINIMHYKACSCRYIIHKENGIINEYDGCTDHLIYKGEYLNGKRNGKGYEYTLNGELIFEGEYLNGKRWNGNGKEYYNDGQLKFEGFYLNGKKWKGRELNSNNKKLFEFQEGKAILKEYNSFNILIYEGEHYKGFRNGKGKEYNKNREKIFEGIFFNGKKWNGVGKEFYKDGSLKYKGEYMYNHKKIGRNYVKGKVIYEGEYLYDKKWNGRGYDEDGKFAYILENGNGKMVEYDDDKSLIFKGEFKEGRRIYGTEYCTGKIYEGYYENDMRNGKGREYINGRLEFEGEFLNGKKFNGKGFDEYGNIIYELNNGNGYAREYCQDKLIFEGEYLNGKRNGEGTEYDRYGIIYKGNYLDGKRAPKNVYISNNFFLEKKIF